MTGIIFELPNSLKLAYVSQIECGHKWPYFPNTDAILARSRDESGIKSRFWPRNQDEISAPDARRSAEIIGNAESVGIREKHQYVGKIGSLDFENAVSRNRKTRVVGYPGCGRSSCP
jgi:hypothetical protein